MPGGLSITNQQPQLGLGFPAPPTGDPSGYNPSDRYRLRVVDYRTLKERRLFGRSKGYRDLTLAGSESEKTVERYTNTLHCTIEYISDFVVGVVLYGGIIMLFLNHRERLHFTLLAVTALLTFLSKIPLVYLLQN